MVVKRISENEIKPKWSVLLNVEDNTRNKTHRHTENEIETK